MKLTGETKLFIGIFIITILVIAGAAGIMTKPAKPISKNELILPTTHTKGPTEAPLWLVEFSDFECPACKAFSSTVADLGRKYPDKLLIAYRYFPLDMHPNALPAAIAAEAAGKQGKFWDMEQALFTNQTNLTGVVYEELAKQFGLDMRQFTADMADPAIQQLVRADYSYGTSIGVNATPTFFLNGRKLNPLSPADLVQEVEKALVP